MLGDLINTCVLVYLDSIFIYLIMAEDYTRYIRAVFSGWLNQSSICNVINVFFFLPEVEFLRHMVSEHQVLVSPGKVSAMYKWPILSLFCDK